MISPLLLSKREESYALIVPSEERVLFGVSFRDFDVEEEEEEEEEEEAGVLDLETGPLKQK